MAKVTLSTGAVGTTFTMNQNPNGHRYYPAICATGDTAFVTWYDRRAGGDPEPILLSHGIQC